MMSTTSTTTTVAMANKSLLVTFIGGMIKGQGLSQPPVNLSAVVHFRKPIQIAMALIASSSAPLQN